MGVVVVVLYVPKRKRLKLAHTLKKHRPVFCFARRGKRQANARAVTGWVAWMRSAIKA